jgi:hypothetical protein
MGLADEIKFCFGHRSNNNKCKIKHFGIYRAVFFYKEKVIRICAHIMLLALSGTGNKYATDLIFSVVFVATFSQK